MSDKFYGWKWDKYRDDWKQYYGSIINATNSHDLRSAPFYYLYGGYVLSGSLTYAGSGGDYWSSTAYSSTFAHYLHFNSSGVYPSANTYRYFGFSIRCLAR